MKRGVCLVISQLINSFQQEGEGLNPPLLVSGHVRRQRRATGASRAHCFRLRLTWFTFAEAKKKSHAQNAAQSLIGQLVVFALVFAVVVAAYHVGPET